MCGGNETVTALFFSLQSSTMLSFILLSSFYSFFYLSFILLSSIKYMSGADGGGPGMGVVALERNGVSFVGSKAKKQQLLAGSGRGVLPLPLMVWIDILPTSPAPRSTCGRSSSTCSARTAPTPPPPLSTARRCSTRENICGAFLALYRGLEPHHP
jgi:hypothetical protein